MKLRALLQICLLVLLSTLGFAQGNDPSNNIAKSGKILTLSDGKYDEFFKKDSLERVGSVIINRHTRKIENLDAKTVEKVTDHTEQSRFLSVDPITKKFAELSPYQYASNRPIEGIDLDGLEFAPGTYDYKNALYIGNLFAPKERQLTQQQIEQWGDAMNSGDRMGKLAGLGLSIDLYTGGRISQFLFYSELYGAFEHNKAKTPEGIAAQNARAKEAIANSFLTWGYGKFLQAGLIATKEAIPLFRGTTVGFPGNRALQVLGVTPTSTDPAVATIMATEAEAYGEGVVYITNTKKFANAGVSENVLAKSENEVAVGVSPSNFPGYSTTSLTPKEARGILKDMGISIPNIIKKGDISTVLNDTRKLSPDEVKEFLKRAEKLKSSN